MKKLIIAICLIVLSGCCKWKDKPYVILAKFNLWDKKPYCEYYYNHTQSFDDSCSKYNVGDTIK